MNREIQEYLECAEEMRLQLENTYQFCMFQGDKIGAHEAVKSMMEYGVIERDDPRVSVNTKLFGGNNGVDVRKRENWGNFDYRRTDCANFIPRYLFGKIGNYEVFYCKTLAHWGKRVEGNYEGDIKIAENSMKFKVRQLNYHREAQGALEDIDRFYKMNRATFANLEEMKKMVEVGVVRMFKIEAVGNIINKYRTFGWGMMKMDDNGVLQIKTVIKYEAVYNNWIELTEIIEKFSHSLVSLCGGNANVGHMVNPKSAMEHQSMMLNNEKIKDKTHDEDMKKHAELMKQKEAEKAAKKAAKKKPQAD